ncbi:MAG: hypothetical protein K8F91_18330 [Candidatus Obscuribacterales bacterium]|nr:hypothetical protein [Candidatus Obscuribacterales bacterium]
MRIITTVLALVAVLNLSILPSVAQTATFIPGKDPGIVGTVTGKVPINKVGNLWGSDLQAILSESTIDVVDTGDGQTRLTGVPILSSFEKRSGKILWTGVCYWRGGKDRQSVAGKNANKKEVIVLKDGKKFVGEIGQVNRDWVEINTEGDTEKVRTKDISSLKSPYATSFQCYVDSPDGRLNQVTEGPASIKFNQTYDRSAEKLTRAPVVRSGEGMSKQTKILLGVAAVLLIVTAIAVPLAVAIPAANSNRGRRNANQNQQNLFLQNILQPPAQNQNQNQ